MTESLLEANEIRVDVAGVPQIEGLTLRATGEHVLVLGAARALFEAASGLRLPARGEIRVRGRDARLALRDGQIACAPLDPPLPPKWTAREYVSASAAIAGHGVAAARSQTKNAIERMKLHDVAGQRLGKAAPHARRATVIAAAIAVGASTLLLEDPLSGLSEDIARDLGRVLAEAIDEQAWVVFASRIPLTSQLATSADEALLLVGDHVVSQGAPAELAALQRTFGLRVHGASHEFARRVEDRGGRVEGSGAQIVVELGDALSTTDLLALAMETGAVVLELRPVAHAFA